MLRFFSRFVLNVSDSFDHTGTMSWKLVICLAVAWLLVFACLFAGIQSSGKAVYVTATLPYVVLLILLIRGATLPGAGEGVKFYVIPNFQKLKEIKVRSIRIGAVRSTDCIGTFLAGMGRRSSPSLLLVGPGIRRLDHYG